MELSWFATFKTLPSPVVSIFDRAGADDFFLSRAWFEALAAHALAPKDEVMIGVLNGAGGEALAALPLVRRADPQRLRRGSEIGSLTNFYSCRFAPVVLPGLPLHTVSGLVSRLCAELPRLDCLEINALRADSGLADAVEAGMRGAGLATSRFFHFGNWYEAVDGADFQTYLARRPGFLRSTLKRKQRKLAGSRQVTFRIWRDATGLEAGIEAYESVYSASWKGGEPFPDFAPNLLRRAGEAGALRLGVAFVDGAPGAAQIWLVAGGRATIFKLAHRREFDALSPGTLLTAHMMQHVLEHDHVRECDLGRGDDDYKRHWLSQRRAYVGVLGFSRRSAAGLLGAARHVWAPALLRRARGVRSRQGAPAEPG